MTAVSAPEVARERERERENKYTNDHDTQDDGNLGR